MAHEARSLSLVCDDPDNLNLMLDHLRGMLMDIGAGELQAQENAIKAIGQLIHDEDQEMEATRKIDPGKVGEKFCYIMGLTKALSMIRE